MSPRERAARRLCRFNPTCAKVCEECAADVDAVLDEIREPSEVGIRAGGGALDYPSVYMGGPSKNGMRKARAVWDSMIDAIKRGEG